MAGDNYQMRQPCPDCGSPVGVLVSRNGQDCIFCIACDKHCYNAPHSETGKPQRSTQSRAGISPSTRARILLRDNSRCFMCGRSPADGVIVVIGHLISVADGQAHGLTPAQVDSDENLAVQCEECNFGLGARTVPLRMAIAILTARLARQP